MAFCVLTKLLREAQNAHFLPFEIIAVLTPVLLVTQTRVWNPTNRAKPKKTDRPVRVNQDLVEKKPAMFVKVNYNGMVFIDYERNDVN